MEFSTLRSTLCHNKYLDPWRILEYLETILTLNIKKGLPINLFLSDKIGHYRKR